MSETGAVSGIIACEGCGAEIFFVPTTRGKMAPVEKEPVFLIEEKGGPIAGFAHNAVGGWPYLRGRRFDGSRDEGQLARRVHISHHATCPEAPRFRG